jgi:outer membrane receptor protein involved in Fe transport
LFLVTSLAHTGPALADDVADEADLMFTLGAERYQAGDYPHALAYFLASNRLARNRNVLFNIARCYEQLKQFPEAHRYYSRALDGETDAAAVARINEAITRISPHIAVLTIVTDPPGARIYLDRKDLGERGTAPQKIALPPASYRVIAELDGFEEASSEPVQVTVGQERSVVLKLKRIVGSIHVTGPVGAAVRLDAENTQAVCLAPCDAVAPPGQHTVIISRSGYRPMRIPVAIQANTTSSITPELVPETGSLVVNSDERDATVEVDGRTQGFTPAILNVPVGTHRVRVSLQGFMPVEREVSIREGQQSQIQVSLLSRDSVEAASRVSESVDDAPASVSIIPAQELRAMRYPTLADALRGVRGIYISDDRGYQSLGFRGFGRPGAYGNRVLITMDGAPLNDDWLWSSYVGFDLRADLEDIDRIEVVRGPGSVLYGTSAFSGVVNLVTRARDVPTSREVSVSASAGSTARARARVTQRLGKDAGFWTSVAGGYSAGRDFFFPEYVSDGPPEVSGHARGVDTARFATLTGRAFYEALSLAWSLQHHDKELPTGQFETLLGDARTHQADTRGLLEARFEPKLGSSITSLTRLHADVYAYRGHFARPPDQGGLEYNEYDSYWGGLEQRFVYAPTAAFSANLGGEVQAHPNAHQRGGTETEGEQQNDEQHFVVAAVYGNLDVRPVKPIKLSLGGRLDYYSNFGSSVNPRVALIARPYPGGNLKVIAGKAFKAPSVYELSYIAVGQGNSLDLKPENVYSAEVEFSHRTSRSVVLTAAAFTNYVTDLISLEGGTGTEEIHFVNLSTPVGTLGGELEARRDWKEGWMVSASYSFQRSAYLAHSSLSDLFTLKRSPEYREVPNAPTHLASLRGAVPILSRSLTLMSRLSLEGGRYDSNDRTSSPGTQTRTGPALIWDFVFTGVEKRWGLSYSLGVYNAFDSRARVPVSTEFRQRTIPIAGRSLLASAALSF